MRKMAEREAVEPLERNLLCGGLRSLIRSPSAQRGVLVLDVPAQSNASVGAREPHPRMHPLICQLFSRDKAI